MRKIRTQRRTIVLPQSSARTIKYYPKIIHLQLLHIFDGHLPTSFSFPEDESTVERNMVEGEVWPCLYFLNWHAINELMTFPKFLAKSCYWNSFLLSFQDYLLLFTFFNHYINMGVFIPLIWVITACVQWTKGEGGKKSNPLLTEMNSKSERLRFPSILLQVPIFIR